jgi:hypothetical protein
VSAPVLSATTDGSLLVVLLTGGGLALIGSVLGRLLASRDAARRERSARAQGRRFALLDFRRESLVRFQDLLVETSELAQDDGRRETMSFRARLLLTRIGDEELRELWHRRQGSESRGGGVLTAEQARARTIVSQRLFERTGELMREVDERLVA